MKEYFANKYARIYYEEQWDTLFLKYLGKVPNDQEFIKINQAVLDAFVSLSTQRFVVDARKMGIISLAAQGWVGKTLLPGMFKHLKGAEFYHAQLLDAKDVMSKVPANAIKKKSSDAGSEIIQFTTEEELNAYLQNLNSVLGKQA